MTPDSSASNDDDDIIHVDADHYCDDTNTTTTTNKLNFDRESDIGFHRSRIYYPLRP